MLHVTLSTLFNIKDSSFVNSLCFLTSLFLAPCSQRSVTEGPTYNSYLCIYPPFCLPFLPSVFLSVVFSYGSAPSPRIPPSPAGAGEAIARGPYKTVPCVSSHHQLYRWCALLILWCEPEHCKLCRPKMVPERILPPLWSGHGSPFTVCPEGDLTSAAPDPVPSACPQPTINVVWAPRDCHLPVSPWWEFPSTPPPTSEDLTPPRLVDPPAPPWLLTPSSPPWPICPLALPGSFIPSAPPQSSVAPVPLRPSGFPSPPRSRRNLLHLGPPDPPRRSCSSALRIHLGLLLHLLHRCWSAPWSRQLFNLHGSSLR